MSNAPHTWPRLYVGTLLADKLSLTLSPAHSHYIGVVLRLREGDSLRFFNGRDGEWRGMITQPSKGKTQGTLVTLVEQLRAQSFGADIWLCPAPIKRAHFDFMIMKATELGARVIQPILTARAQIRETNTERLRAIAIEAAEQSERLDLPEIREPVTLDSLIKEWPKHRLPIYCAEFGDAQPAAQAFSGALAHARPAAAIFTGPEGGFTEDESARLRAMAETLPVRLGPRILRADTAALAALACWQALCGDWQSRDFSTRPTEKREAPHEP